MNPFTHNPIEITAIQVTRPFSAVQKKVPLAHRVDRGNGAFGYFAVTLRIGGLVTKQAKEDDWIIRHPDTTFDVLSDSEFQRLYGKPDEDTEG